MYLLLIAFALGLIVGILVNGVRINVNHVGKEIPEETNKVNTQYMPEDYKLYVEKTQGFINE